MPGDSGLFNAESLQKLFLALPSFQGQFGNVGVGFNPQQAVLQQALLKRLTGKEDQTDDKFEKLVGQGQSLLSLLQNFSNFSGMGGSPANAQTPSVSQTPTVQPIPFGSRPLGLLQEPGFPGFQSLGRMR